jgi:hypothetical protein
VVDEVLPRLNLIDGGELTELQEEQIDMEILGADTNIVITPPASPVIT